MKVLRRIPDWILYIGVLTGVTAVSLNLAEKADAPPAPPAPGQAETSLFGPVTPFDLEATVNAPDRTFQPTSGTAFSIADEGRWVTARHVVEGCRRPAILVGGGRAVAAAFRLAPHADLALLITDGGSAALPLSSGSLRIGQLAFHPGFPQARAGEVSSRLLGEDVIRSPGRGRLSERVLVWAEVGRTEGQGGALSGLSGAPVLDRMGRVVGVTVAEAPRRGRIYTTTPEVMERAIRSQAGPAAPLDGQISIENYGRVSDDLRRNLRVAQVICLA